MADSVAPRCKPQIAFGASLNAPHSTGRVLSDPEAPREPSLPLWAEVTTALLAAASHG